jgi:hypothetical protein
VQSLVHPPATQASAHPCRAARRRLTAAPAQRQRRLALRPTSFKLGLGPTNLRALPYAPQHPKSQQRPSSDQLQQPATCLHMSPPSPALKPDCGCAGRWQHSPARVQLSLAYTLALSRRRRRHGHHPVPPASAQELEGAPQPPRDWRGRDPRLCRHWWARRRPHGTPVAALAAGSGPRGAARTYQQGPVAALARQKPHLGRATASRSPSTHPAPAARSAAARRSPPHPHPHPHPLHPPPPAPPRRPPPADLGTVPPPAGEDGGSLVFLTNEPPLPPPSKPPNAPTKFTRRPPPSGEGGRRQVAAAGLLLTDALGCWLRASHERGATRLCHHQEPGPHWSRQALGRSPCLTHVSAADVAAAPLHLAAGDCSASRKQTHLSPILWQTATAPCPPPPP